VLPEREAFGSTTRKRTDPNPELPGLVLAGIISGPAFSIAIYSPSIAGLEA